MKNLTAVATITALAAALGLTAVSAHAQRGQGPCRDDIQKFCPNVKPGGGRYRECLQQHTTELSPACQQHIKQMAQKAAPWREACQADVQKLCSDTSPGHRDIMKCLRQHEADLSQSCKDQLPQGGSGRGKADAGQAQ